MIILCCNLLHAQSGFYFYNNGAQKYWTTDSSSINLIVTDTTDLLYIYQNTVNYFNDDAEVFYSDEDDNMIITSRNLPNINLNSLLYVITQGHPEKISYYSYAKIVDNERLWFRNEVVAKVKKRKSYSGCFNNSPSF